MLKRTTWRPAVAALVLLITIAVFASYFARHPEIGQTLGDLPLGIIGILLGLWLLFIFSLALINAASLRICRASISSAESLLLTMYSSIVNFFGPLQSGPAFRALYLKQKHGIKIRDYTGASFVYYFFYAFFSGLLLLSGAFGVWLALPVLIAAFGLIYIYRNPPERFHKLSLGAWPFMAMATFIQVCLMVVIYYVELKAVLPGVELDQVLVYTGAANFALFVSLTPGAIGFRESFLLFSQRLHGIDATTIVAANLIDRSVYILLLVLLIAGIFGSHANRRFTRLTK